MVLSRNTIKRQLREGMLEQEFKTLPLWFKRTRLVPFSHHIDDEFDRKATSPDGFSVRVSLLDECKGAAQNST